MKIYTKTGDDGTTSLIGGERVLKSDSRLEAYGTADELNSYIGWLRAMSLPTGTDEMLHTIQNKLFVLGASLATPVGKTHKPGTTITNDMVEKVEHDIDALSADLPPQTGFILPGGSQTIALCHVCRTVARRLERNIVALAQQQAIDSLSIQYVNRISDFLFILSRKIAFVEKKEVFLWEM